MNRLGLGLALGLLTGCLWGMGLTEDPSEVLTRTWTLATAKSLDIRGEVQFQLKPGPSFTVTVTTSRALFDQLTVSNWWGAATVAIETGLRGPRERGNVTIVMELPGLESLSVTGASSGRVLWPGQNARVFVGEASGLTLDFRGESLAVEASWKSHITTQGQASRFSTVLRHQSRLSAADFAAETALLAIDEQSSAEMGPVTEGSGTARHGSRVVAATPNWSGLLLREGATLRVAD